MSNINRIMLNGSRAAILVKNTFFLSIGRFFILLASFATVALFARFMGTTGYGQYLILFAYVTLLVETFGISLETVLVRDLSNTNRPTQEATLWNGILIKCVGGLIGAAVLPLTIFMTNRDPELLIAAIPASISIIISSIILAYVSVIRASLKLFWEVVVDLAGKLTFLMLFLISVFWVKTTHLIVAASCAYLIAELLRLVAVMMITKRFLIPCKRYDKVLKRYLLKQSVPLGIANTIGALYRRADKFMLTYLIGFTAVGIYGASYKIIEILFLLSAIIMSSLFTMLSRDAALGIEAVYSSYKKAIGYNFMLGSIITIFLIITGRILISLIFGAEYYESASVLYILSFLAPLIFVGNVLGHTMVILERQGVPYITIRTGSLVNEIVLMLILVPIIGTAGAAYSLLIAESIGCLSLFLYIEFDFRMKIRFASGLAGSK
jgi:O-antigen/teichoic acid export membrane protein